MRINENKKTIQGVTRMKQYLFLLVLLFLPAVSALEQCQSVLQVGEACRMLTPTLSCTGDYNYTCFMKNGTTAQQGNLTALADSIYYFNFTQTTETGYICELCDGSTREISVERNNNTMLIFLLFAWIIYALVLWLNDRWLKYMAGAFFLVIGMFALTYGIGNLNDWFSRSIGFIHIGVGLLVILIEAFKDL
jgi:hypothetical protein